jgi:hypothetical protein
MTTSSRISTWMALCAFKRLVVTKVVEVEAKHHLCLRRGGQSISKPWLTSRPTGMQGAFSGD